MGTETAETHFPCFNKSYLRFAPDTIPPGKEIISATMTLYLWGNAGYTPSDPQPSWVHLFSIKDPWVETTITWNNAPLAYENVNAIRMNPYSQPGNIQWPGDAYTWDATQAVAEAYAAGSVRSRHSQMPVQRLHTVRILLDQLSEEQAFSNAGSEVTYSSDSPRPTQ